MQQPPYGQQQGGGGWQQQPPPQQPGGWQQQPPPQQPGGGWQPQSNWGQSGDGYEPPPERNWLLIGGIAAAGFFCLLIVAIVICVLTLGSGDNDSSPTAVTSLGTPRITINQPAGGQTFTVGDTITVQAQATDPGTGVTRVELLVNNVVVDSQTSENPVGEKTLSVLLDYNAAVPQQNLILTVRAYRGPVRGEDATVVVNVADRSGSTGNNQVPTTSSNTTGGNTVPTAIPTFNPVCRARVDVTTLNFRAGPSLDYAILGKLNLGNELALVGRLGDNSWWEVNSGGTRGWISAALTTLLGNCGNIPITTPPVSPTPLPTATQAAAQEANLIVSTLTGSKTIVLTSSNVVASYILRVKNVGNTGTGAFNVTITKPDGTTFDYTIPGLAAGAEVEIPDLNASFTTQGTYRLSVFVDSSGNITESNKDDNLASMDITVTDPTPTPEGG